MAPTQTNGTAEISEDVPKWVNAEIFDELLKKIVPEYKSVKGFKAKRALALGENYATTMLRIEICMELNDGSVKNISFMMKIPIDSPIFKEMLKDHNIFTEESTVFQEIVPEMEQMYCAAGVDVKFGAECYKLPTSEDYVLLEDLRPHGFKNVNRLEGLDMEHTKCVLKKLAQWHAASATRIETKGIYTNIIVTGFFDEDKRLAMQTMTDVVSKVFIKCIESYEGHEAYIESVRALQLKVVDEMLNAFKVDPNDFNVLNHGDCWSNNIMFQYDAFGKIKETYFVDLQLPRYGTPAQDLLYFLLSSTSFNIKLEKFDYFVKYYHDHLIEYLKVLKYPKKLPSLKHIHIKLYKCGVWGYSTLTGVMAAVALENTESANLNNFLMDNEESRKFKTLMFSNATYRKLAEAILPWLHNRGALE